MTDQSGLEPDCLQRHVSHLIPGGRLVKTRLPLCPEIVLWLLNADYPQHELDADTCLRLMNEPTYWPFCWASGQVMARHLLDQTVLVAGKSVLDFGCGSAVAGIAAALAGARRVIACDLDPVALAASRYNADLNGVELQILPDLFQLDEPVDLVLVADVLYDRENLPLLQQLNQVAPVLLADSRVRDFAEPGYTHLGVVSSHTVPDLAESGEFNRVNLYASAPCVAQPCLAQ